VLLQVAELLAGLKQQRLQLLQAHQPVLQQHMIERVTQGCQCDR
jgi:hypothetical protein